MVCNVVLVVRGVVVFLVGFSDFFVLLSPFPAVVLTVFIALPSCLEFAVVVLAIALECFSWCIVLAMVDRVVVFCRRPLIPLGVTLVTITVSSCNALSMKMNANKIM